MASSRDNPPSATAASLAPKPALAGNFRRESHAASPPGNAGRLSLAALAVPAEKAPLTERQVRVCVWLCQRFEGDVARAFPASMRFRRNTIAGCACRDTYMPRAAWPPAWAAKGPAPASRRGRSMASPCAGCSAPRVRARLLPCKRPTRALWIPCLRHIRALIMP